MFSLLTYIIDSVCVILLYCSLVLMVQYFFKFDLIQKAGTGHMQCCEITCCMHMFDQRTSENGDIDVTRMIMSH